MRAIVRSFLSASLIAALTLIGFGAPARASVPDIVTLDDLVRLLDGTPGGVPGYFLTVPGGSTEADQSPVQVKMTVKSVVEDYGPDGALIMFEADMTDPVMQNIGGIAQGMSGSPLYITPYWSSDPLMIGALSYGDAFTLNGLGLATPIEYMIDTAAEFPTLPSGKIKLPEPVRTSAGPINTVRITDVAEPRPAKAGTATFAPLLAVRISGLPETSVKYQALAKQAAAQGLRLVAPGGGGASAPSFSTPLVPGSMIGTYLTMGAFTAGGYGTVTYDDGDKVVAFGHPLLWSGPSDAIVSNVWTDGIWGSLYASYKVATPGAVRGTLVQDRSAAVIANTAKAPVQVPINAKATVSTDKVRTRAGASGIVPGALSTELGVGLADAAAATPLIKAANQASLAGTAHSKTTIVVSDGSAQYTIARNNIFSTSDVLADATTDVATALAQLTSTPGLTPRVVSIDFETAVDETRRNATIVGMRGGPLQVGQNTAVVTVKPDGTAPSFEVPVDFTIPPGTPLNGSLSAESAGGSDSSFFDFMDLFSMGGGASQAGASTVAELVQQINDAPLRDEILIRYYGGDDDEGAILGRAKLDYDVAGYASPASPSGGLMVEEPAVPLGSEIEMMAMVVGAQAGDQVSLERKVGGTNTWQAVATAPIQAMSGSSEDSGMNVASFKVSPDASATYRATWAGSADVLGWTGSVDITVIPPLTLTGQRKGGGWRLAVGSDPGTAGSPVQVEVKRDGSWRQVAQGTLDAQGQANLWWQTPLTSGKARAIMPATARYGQASSGPVRLAKYTLSADLLSTPRRAGNVGLRLSEGSGRPVLAARYRVQAKSGKAWEQVAAGRTARKSRLWLGNGTYRVVVPKQKKVSVRVSQTVQISGAQVWIAKAAGGRGRASVKAGPQMPLRFVVQKQSVGRWQTVGGIQRLSGRAWNGSLPPGRYRFAFDRQFGFDAANSKVVRVR